jgi:FAD-dependent urate hydroxylase
VTDTQIPVAIIGSGPYGLAAAAHLRGGGATVRMFGPSMSFWSEMPRGMLLRSPYVASTIGNPTGALSLDAYGNAIGKKITKPVPLDDFVNYGRWFAGHFASEHDERRVAQVERDAGAFRLTLSDGEQVQATRVVVAAGIAPFAARPPQFGDLGPELVSHSSEHADLSTFAGKRVIVIGAGQSALESAALLHEGGATTEVVVRSEIVHWLRQTARWTHNLDWVSRILYAPADVGPAGVSQLVAAPNWWRRLPRRTQDKLGPRAIRPAGAAWLVDRLATVPITTGRSVRSAREVDGAVELTLDDGTVKTCDHVLLATGFRVNISGYGFLPDSLLQRIDQIDGYPRLSSGFETSVPGLYIVGAPAAWSFGPLMRFVVGSEYVAPALAGAILGSGSNSKPS